MGLRGGNSWSDAGRGIEERGELSDEEEEEVEWTGTIGTGARRGGGELEILGGGDTAGEETEHGAERLWKRAFISSSASSVGIPTEAASFDEDEIR